ncbi:MAG: hypothetical protein AAF512_19760 [Pseudomonadota bacterium]
MRAMLLTLVVGFVGGLLGGYISSRSQGGGGTSKGLYKYLAIGIFFVLVFLFFVRVDMLDRGMSVQFRSWEEVSNRFKSFSGLLKDLREEEKQEGK